MRGWFVTGTGTGVGKTVLAAAMAASLRAQGTAVVVRKPVITGLDEPPDADWPPDHQLLGAAAGCDPAEVAPLTFGAPVSPHLAAHLTGEAIDAGELVAGITAAAPENGVLIVEGVGGLLVPLTDDFAIRDLARALGLPLVVSASPGLGTINHTLLTLEAARAAGLTVAAVVLTPWPRSPQAIERSNRDTIARLGDVRVEVLPEIARADVDLLAGAGSTLAFVSSPACTG